LRQTRPAILKPRRGAGSRLVAYAAGGRRLPPAMDPGAPL